VVAHRAGNDPAALARALALGVQVVELDLHVQRGRPEVRHAKRVIGSPVLWERWRLEDALARPPRLEEVLDAAAAQDPPVTPMLDLKGADPRLPRVLRRVLAGRAGPRPVLVCGRVWRNLAPLADTEGVRVVHSAGTPRELRALLARFPDARSGLDGVSVKRTMLDAEVVAALRARTGTLLTWPVDDAADARLLGAWGVTGCITDHPERLLGGGSAAQG
jgi:glycerophosphoryl diester phosphodiesterase